jgi:hypothetical protein
MAKLFTSNNMNKAIALARSNPRKLLSKAMNVRLSLGPFAYMDDVMTTRQNADMLQDPEFVSAYAAAQATQSWGASDMPWRAYNVCYFAWYASQLEGDFVECGVNRGGGALAIVEYVKFDKLTDRSFYLLDTFEGFAQEYVNEEEKQLGATGNRYEDSYEYVKTLFAEYPNVVLVRGAVPDTLPQVTSSQVAFLSIDMNVVQPEIAAAEYFWPKMVHGGVLLLDDYGWASHRLQKIAFDEFARAHNTRILVMPTGQGVLIKL